MADYSIVGVHKVSDMASLPLKGSQCSACFDLCACFHESSVKCVNSQLERFVIEVDNFEGEDASILVYPEDTVLIPTGLIFCMPETHHMKVYSRSGNAFKKNLIVVNAPGIIDHDYTLETYVLLKNISSVPVKIKHGMRVAQCEVCPTNSTYFHEINESEFGYFMKSVSEKSERDGGIGSTGE